VRLASVESPGRGSIPFCWSSSALIWDSRLDDARRSSFWRSPGVTSRFSMRSQQRVMSGSRGDPCVPAIVCRKPSRGPAPPRCEGRFVLGPRSTRLAFINDRLGGQGSEALMEGQTKNRSFEGNCRLARRFWFVGNSGSNNRPCNDDCQEGNWPLPLYRPPYGLATGPQVGTSLDEIGGPPGAGPPWPTAWAPRQSAAQHLPLVLFLDPRHLWKIRCHALCPGHIIAHADFRVPRKIFVPAQPEGPCSPPFCCSTAPINSTGPAKRIYWPASELILIEVASEARESLPRNHGARTQKHAFFSNSCFITRSPHRSFLVFLDERRPSALLVPPPVVNQVVIAPSCFSVSRSTRCAGYPAARVTSAQRARLFALGRPQVA